MFISVDSWIGLADSFIDRSLPQHKRSDAFRGRIFFIKTDHFPEYIKQLTDHPTPFILITASNDDHCPPYKEYPPTNDVMKKEIDTFLDTSKLVMWFCKNPCIIHEKIQPLPLGPKWQWKTTRFFGEDKRVHTEIYRKYGATPRHRFYNEIKPNLLFFNFSQTSNNPLFSPHKNIRHKCKSSLISTFKFLSNVPFEEYIRTLGTYKFCVSPPGRGIDTHRTWEALMVGTIPIMIHTTIDSLFEKLPVIFVQDWSEITEDFLTCKYEELKNRVDYDFDVLYEPYWLAKINLLLTTLPMKNEESPPC